MLFGLLYKVWLLEGGAGCGHRSCGLYILVVLLCISVLSSNRLCFEEAACGFGSIFADHGNRHTDFVDHLCENRNGISQKSGSTIDPACRDEKKQALNRLLARMRSMRVLVDDVGSFPLPAQVRPELFDEAYVLARRAISAGKDIKEDKFLMEHFYEVIIESFRRKCATGLDIVNYPQHYDMHKQVADVISNVMERGTYLVDEDDAVLPEVHVINGEARRLCEEFGKRISLRVCIAGPLELYLRMVGTVVYEDVLLMFAETVKRFAKKSILDSKYVKTEVVCLDEPSLGFQELSADRDVIIDVLDKAFNFTGATKQIHLHSSLKAADLLEVGNVDVLALESAASPRNIESLSRKMLDEADKYVRVGISRTDVDSISAELHEKGITEPAAEQLVEAEEAMRRRFVLAEDKYGDRMLFAGPDCGLGGWPTQESAELLLRRTVSAVRGTQATSTMR